MKTMLVTLITLFLSAALAIAQDDNLIAYGEMLQGEITVTEYERHYTFEGRAGDIIRAVLTPQASSSGFGGWWYQPEILLLDENEDLLAELHSYESVVLIQQLEETGEYHIIATGWGGRSADNVGKFGLLLEQVPILLDGEVVEGEASRQRGRHYAVQADKDFEIAYDHIGGAFFPTISVNVLAEDPYQCGLDATSCSSDSGGANLHAVAALSGIWLDSGTLNVNFRPSAPDLFIVQVAKREWDHSDDISSAKYTLELKVADS